MSAKKSNKYTKKIHDLLNDPDWSPFRPKYKIIWESTSQRIRLVNTPETKSQLVVGQTGIIINTGWGCNFPDGERGLVAELDTGKKVHIRWSSMEVLKE